MELGQWARMGGALYSLNARLLKNAASRCRESGRVRTVRAIETNPCSQPAPVEKRK